MNGMKQGDALSPLLFNFALEYDIRRVQVRKDSLKLNSKHHLLFYVDYVNILGASVHITKKNTEALVVGTKQNGLEGNAEKTKYGHVSRSECRTKHNIQIDNSFFERVEEFKYLGPHLTNQIYFQEEIKSRLKSGNTCYHSVQHLFSFS